jgi:hypothetical protein
MYPARRIGIALVAAFLTLDLGQCWALTASCEGSTASFSERFNAAARALGVDIVLSGCERQREGRACKHLLSGGAVLLANMADNSERVDELTIIFGRGTDLLAIRRTIEVTMALFAPSSTSDEQSHALAELMRPLTPLDKHREAMVDGVKWVLLSNLNSGIWVLVKQ